MYFRQGWRSAWPTRITASSLAGVRMASNVAHSSVPSREGPEHAGRPQPFIIPPLPLLLRGRDALGHVGTFLISSKDPVLLQMQKWVLNLERV